MINDILLYTGSVVIFLWGIAHIIPTKSIVRGFGEISEDNKRIITMESIAEGITLCFVGVLVFIATLLSAPQGLYVISAAVFLLIMGVLTALTGARTSVLPYKICVVVKSVVAVLFLLGVVL